MIKASFLNIVVILANYSSASDRYRWRHYVFGLCVCECVHAFVYFIRACIPKSLLAWYLKNQTLFDGVFEATDKCIRFWRWWVQRQGNYKVRCEKLQNLISPERLEGFWPNLTQMFHTMVRWTVYLWRSWVQDQGHYKVKYLSELLWREEASTLMLGCQVSSSWKCAFRLVELVYYVVIVLATN